ncbi:M48 family metalloprotease [Roseiconus nitratireducens]|uniref:M48 family metalloprotease n=1 Tax=Roseiconus nitratireducens TaxID=2605748 RepID=A0A5M6DG99_9BACT|nr:M48 family metalloprotease [Roseiconus nitratireducens]KAA5545322.1 M48 family metalloprotease [Roseiconus nitratireducens]
MQLYYFLAIILSLSFGSLPESTQPFASAIGFSSFVIAAWWVLCFLAARLVSESIDQGQVSADLGYRLFDRQMDCFRWLSLGLIALCLAGFGLGRNLDQLPILRHSMALQAAVLLMPALSVMVALWAAEHWFAVRAGWTAPGPIAALRSIGSTARTSVGWVVVPILALLAGVDVISRIPWLQTLPPWLGWVAFAVVLVLCVPSLVRRLFPASPLDDELANWIDVLLRASGAGPMRVLQWDTRGRMHNAMIAGILGRHRVLLVSDRLVADLTRGELAMVILHEVAHARRYHVPLRIAALIPAWLLGAGVQTLVRHQPLAEGLRSWSAALGCLASVLATVLVLRIVSYRSEFDADWSACRWAPAAAEGCPGVPPSETLAARDLGSALCKVTASSEAARKATWLHPAVADRIDRLASHRPFNRSTPSVSD